MSKFKDFITGRVDTTSVNISDCIPIIQDGTTKKINAQRAFMPQAHPGYLFHGFAGSQLSTDLKFYDLSGNCDGVFGANLSVAQAWANAGFVSTVDPAGGAINSIIALGNLNYDYVGGEKLIIWWLGSATPEGADASLMGDGYGAGYPGVRVRVKSTGKMDFGLYQNDGTVLFPPVSTSTAFDGTPHSIGIVIDGQARKYGYWVDEVYDSNLPITYSVLSGGSTVDTRTSNVWNIGAARPAAAGIEGIASRTRSLAILRLSATDPIPSVGAMTALFKQLRANPGRPISRGAF